MSLVRLTDGREAALQAVLDGLRATDRLLISVSSNGSLSPAARGDDPGLFIAVPLLAKSMNLEVTQAFALFAYVLTAIAAVLASIAFMRWTRSTRVRGLALITVLGLSFVALKLGDVYFVAVLLPLAVGPWLLDSKPRTLEPRTYAAAAAIGIAAGLANAIRTQTALPLTVFLLVLVMLAWKQPMKQKLRVATVFLAGMLIIQVALGVTIAQRDTYLASVDSTYISAPAQHVMWHSIYVGLGYVDNQWMPEVTDSVAQDHAATIRPDARYLSTEYEDVLRDEVFGFVREHPRLFLETLAAKIGVVTMYLLAFGAAGVFATIKKRPPWTVTDTALLGAIAAGALPSVLVYPQPAYMGSALAFAALWGVYRFNLVFGESA